MRTPILVSLLAVSICACGNDEDATLDGPTGNRPDPRVIAGGGIGDGPIDGVVNLYVIDDATRAPIAGATVRVGTLDGTTDATGLFVAEGVVGPQTIAVKAGAYRSEVWVGANGANLTMNLEKADRGDPAERRAARADHRVRRDHRRGRPREGRGDRRYSQTDDLGDPANELAEHDELVLRAARRPRACTFTLAARTGKVALIAAIYDRDLKGTPAVFDDDTLDADRLGVPAATSTSPPARRRSPASTSRRSRPASCRR